jgi:putative transposase
MPRLPRFNIANIPQHVVQRGNNRCACFFRDEDFALYLRWLGESAAANRVAIHAYALMTNHVHLLATPGVPGAVSAMMQALGRRYVGYVNRVHHRSGTLWEGRFKACVVDSERYVLTAYRYIELNPVRAGIVSDPATYRWSSHAANVGLRPDRLLTAHSCYLALGTVPSDRVTRYRALCAEVIGAEDLDELRAMSRKELAFGGDHFKAAVEATAGRRARPLRRRGEGSPIGHARS